MEMFIDILSWIMFLGGSTFLIIGGIGFLRLPDLFCRMHGSGMIDTLGVVMLFVGMMLQAGFTFVAVKIFLIILFIMFTSPTGTHALARTARIDGLKPLIISGQGKPEEASPPADDYEEEPAPSKT